MDLGLRDRVAIVAAASSGLGRAIAEALAAEGARLVLCASSEARLAATSQAIRELYHTEVIGQVANVGRPEDLKALVARAMLEFGRVDICVANGPGPPVKRFLETDMSDWKAAIDMNLLSAVSMAREVVPIMSRQRWGRFVVVSSVVAKQPEAGFILSNAVRPGVSGLIRSLADEVGADNITVNAVLPGTFATERLTRVSSTADGSPVFERWINAAALRRLGRPEEFGAAVAFLCSEKASFITGTSLAIDGGFSRGLL